MSPARARPSGLSHFHVSAYIFSRTHVTVLRCSKGVGMGVYKRGKRWYVDFKPVDAETPEDRLRRSAGTTKAEAEALEKRLQGLTKALAVGALDAAERPKPLGRAIRPGAVLAGDALTNLRQTRYRQGEWADTARYMCDVWIEVLGARTDLSKVDLFDAVNRLRDNRKKITDSTVNRYLCILRLAYRKAGLKGHLDDFTDVLKTLKRTGTRVGVIDDEQQHYILEVVRNYPTKNKNNGLVEFFQLLFETGMRSGELRHLAWNRVDFRLGIIKIPKERSKADRPEFVTLTSEGIAILRKRLLRANGPLCFDISESVIKGVWRRVRGQMAIADPNFVPHIIRHTYGTRLYQETRDIRKVQQALRHTNLSTTVRYEQADAYRLIESIRAAMDSRPKWVPPPPPSRQDRLIEKYGADYPFDGTERLDDD